MNKFVQTLKKQNQGYPPVWMMRQAGRYHDHYQERRAKHSFLEICRSPALSAEVAMGPMQDFDFDAAILFSDILFPLDLLGCKVDFNPAPSFDFLLKTLDDLERYELIKDPAAYFAFQAESLTLLRAQLGSDKGMIGFVGGPLTLYVFAVEGTGKSDLLSAKEGLTDKRFDRFMRRLMPVMVQNILTQAAASPDVMAILDSSIGMLSVDELKDIYLPYLESLIKEVKEREPNLPILFYGKNISLEHWDVIASLPIDALGIDHGLDLKECFERYPNHVLQGNFPPDWMGLPENEYQKRLDDFLNQMPKGCMNRWICGLGHGLTPQADQNNVKDFVERVRRICS